MDNQKVWRPDRHMDKAILHLTVALFSTASIINYKSIKLKVLEYLIHGLKLNYNLKMKLTKCLPRINIKVRWNSRGTSQQDSGNGIPRPCIFCVWILMKIWLLICFTKVYCRKLGKWISGRNRHRQNKHLNKIENYIKKHCNYILWMKDCEGHFEKLHPDQNKTLINQIQTVQSSKWWMWYRLCESEATYYKFTFKILVEVKARPSKRQSKSLDLFHLMHKTVFQHLVTGIQSLYI